MACHSLSVAYESGVENWMSGCIGATRLGRCGSDQPARDGGILAGIRSQSQEKSRHVGLLRRQQQFARGGQVQTLRVAPRRDDDGARATNTETVRSSFQDILR